MTAFLLLFFLTSLLSVGRFQELTQPTECEYVHDIKTYFCKNVFDVFPNQLYGNYHLKCDDCNIRSFTNKTFPFTNSLVSFNASESGIRYITSGAFSKLSNTQYIYLEHNEILEIFPKAFAGLRQVYEVHLEHNRIVNLFPGFLADIEVSSIDMSDNKIRELTNGIFEGALGVLTLDLSINNIKKIWANAFEGLESLEVLNLEKNQICSLPLGVFKELNVLRVLNLADNKFTKFAIGSFSGLKNLNSLNLANNTMSVFDGNMLLPFNHLSKLDISGNGIYYFDANTLRLNAPTLRVIRMDDNPFSCTLLMNIIQYFKSVNVEVMNSVGRFGVQNVNGIACVDLTINERVNFNEFLQEAEKDAKKYSIYC